MIEMNGMEKLVFCSDDNDGIAGISHPQRNKYSEESDDDQAEENNSSNFTFLTHPLDSDQGVFHSATEGLLCLQISGLKVNESLSQHRQYEDSILLIFVSFIENFEKFYLLFSQQLLVPRCGDPLIFLFSVTP